MRKYELKTVEVEKKTLKSVVCDCCKVEFSEVMDIQEFLYIDFVGGYGSIFGDGDNVTAEICQACVKSKLGEFLRISEYGT